MDAGREIGTNAANPLPPGLLAILPGNDLNMQTDVLVFSPENGELIDERLIPGVLLTGTEGAPSQTPVIGRRNFSDDGRFVTWIADCELRVAELDGNAYVEKAKWTPPQSFSESKACFDHPEFVADSTTVQVRLLAGDPTNEAGLLDDGEGPKPLRLMSADAQAPDGDLQEVEKLRRRDAERATVVDVVDFHDGLDGGPDDNLYGCNSTPVFGDRQCSLLIATATEIRELTLAFFEGADDPAEADAAAYTCPEPVDGDTALCVHQQGPALVGSVAFADVDRSRMAVELRQAAPETPEQVIKAVPSPDGEAMFIVTSSGWFRTDADGSAEPQLVFDGLVDPQERIDSTGVHLRVEWIDG